VNHGIGVILPEFPVPRDSVADKIVGIEINDEFPRGREMSEILGLCHVKIWIGPLVDVPKRARRHSRSKLADPYIQLILRIVVDKHHFGVRIGRDRSEVVGQRMCQLPQAVLARAAERNFGRFAPSHCVLVLSAAHLWSSPHMVVPVV
jgi:hypothetical protein